MRYLGMRQIARAAAVFIAFSLSSCHPSEPEKDDNRTIFNYNEMNGVTSLDPATANSLENMWPVNLLFNGLVQMDDSLNVIPCIARTYSISADGKEYVFRLRNNVYFHDNECFENKTGRAVTSKDFLYSYTRLFDSKVSSATTLLDKVDRSAKTSYKGFDAPDDSTFKITLREPFSAFINILTMKFFSVIPYEAIDMYGQDFRRNPVGTGPFKFSVWDEGNKLILHKNQKYFESDESGARLPYLDAVTVSFIRDRETAFMELLNGRFDMLSGADAFNTNEVLDKEGNLRSAYLKKFYLQKQTFLKTDYIGILVDEKNPIVNQSPLKLKAIRQALNYGFDREKLVKYLRNNLGTAAHAGFIPKGMKSFAGKNFNGYFYAPDKVRELLKEAGYENGKGLPEITLHITDNYKEQVEFIQSQLADNNIRVKISIEKTPVLRQAVNNGEYLLFKKSWVADYADEQNFMSLFYSRNFSPQGSNYFHYSNPHFDRLYEKAQTENNVAEKTKLYRQMDSTVTADAPFITLYYDQVVRLVSRNVEAFSSNPLNMLNLKRTKKKG